jgi:uncharacterized protein YbjT (DUF2867 family)
MNVLIFGATGMVGQAALRECLLAGDVQQVVTMGRTATGAHDSKLKEIVHRDLTNYSGMEDCLRGFDACFFCLGVTSSGMKEAEYTRLTYDITLAAAEALSVQNPGMTFIYVSGSGTDSTEKGRSMWARVKGRTENALLRLPLKAFMLRPGFIQPLDGIESKTPSYRMFYKVLSPLMPSLHRALPNQVLTTRQMGQAMLSIARIGFEKRILEAKDIRAAAER